jgi:hypothetical protein
MMKKIFFFNFYEMIIIGICLILFCLIGACLFFNISIIELYEHQKQQNQKNPVGSVLKIEGSMRRQTHLHSGFSSLYEHEKLYQEDTIITQSDSSATILLNPDIQIHLNPNVMLKIVFLSTTEKNNITHTPRIELISGEIEAKNGKASMIIQKKNTTVVLKPNAQEQIKIENSPFALNQKNKSLELIKKKLTTLFKEIPQEQPKKVIAKPPVIEKKVTPLPIIKKKRFLPKPAPIIVKPTPQPVVKPAPVIVPVPVIKKPPVIEKPKKIPPQAPPAKKEETRPEGNSTPEDSGLIFLKEPKAGPIIQVE